MSNALDIQKFFKRLEGSSEKIIHRLKNPEVSNPITRGEAREWLDWKDRGIFQSMNYFFAGSTFQFGIRRISTLVLTVPVMLLPIWKNWGSDIRKTCSLSFIILTESSKRIKEAFFHPLIWRKNGLFRKLRFFFSQWHGLINPCQWASGMDWKI